MRPFNTLTGFLSSTASNPSTDDTVEFQGYAAVGDGGGATWQHNGVTAQTVSQSPAQLGDALLNDGNGNQWAIVGNTINALSIGVIADYDEVLATGTDNWGAINAGMEGLGLRGGGELFFPDAALAYGYGQAIRFRHPNVVVRAETSGTRLICTGTTDAAWPNYGSVLLGTYTVDNADKLTHYGISATVLGSESITITGGHVFSAGEVILVTSTSTYQISTEDRPTVGEMNVVTAQVGTAVSLRYPVTNGGLLQVASLSDDPSIWETGGIERGITQFAPRDCKILGGWWKTVHLDGPFRGGGGFIGCEIKPDRITARTGVAYGNLAAHSVLECNSDEYTENGVELAYLSHFNVVNIGTISHNGNTNVNQNAPIRINEGSYGNTVRVNNLNTGTTEPVSLVSVVAANNNTISVGYIKSKLGTFQGVHVQDAAFTGVKPDTSQNDITINNIESPTIGGGVFFQGVGQCFGNKAKMNCSVVAGSSAIKFEGVDADTKNMVYDSNFGSGEITSGPLGNIVRDSFVPDGVDVIGQTDVKGLRTSKSSFLHAVDTVETSVAVTSGAPHTTQGTIKEDSFLAGDQITLESSADTGSGAGNRQFDLRIGGQLIKSYVTTTQQVLVKTELMVTPNSFETVAFCEVKITKGLDIVVSEIINITLNLGIQNLIEIESSTASASQMNIRRTEISSMSLAAGEV